MEKSVIIIYLIPSDLLGKTSSSYKETGMLRLDLMPMNNGQEQWDALEWEKPMTEEKDF